MLDTEQLGVTLRAVLAGEPAIRPYLRRVGERVAKTGVLHGRMKLGERLSNDAMNGLRRVFPNAALEIKPDGVTTVRLDRLNLTEEDATVWITALVTIFDIPRTSCDVRRQAVTDVATLLDRCRLSFPELSPLWDYCHDREAELITALQSRSLEVVQREYYQLAQAVQFLLSDHEPLGLAEFSARCFEDSKVLKSTPALLRRLEEWLLCLRDDESNESIRQRVLEAYGVVENATAIKVTVFGPLIYYKYGERFDWIAQLHARGETATLSWDNLRGIDAIELPEGTPVITCENETPFGTLVRERVPGLIVYSAGYPNTAVCRVLHLLPAHIETIHHWGDSDLDGLRIAAMLHQIRPVQLWRCNRTELQRHYDRLLLQKSERREKAKSYLTAHPDFPFADELAFTIENGWLEQESWIKDIL